MAYPRFRQSRAHKIAKLISGNVTVTSTSFVAVDTGLDRSLRASVGDELEVAISLQAQNQAFTLNFDIGTVVAGSVVNRFGGTNGVAGWNNRGGNYFPSSGAAFYTVVAGDLSDGLVTLRLLAKLETAGSRVVIAVSESPLQIAYKNLGPPA